MGILQFLRDFAVFGGSFSFLDRLNSFS